VLYIIDTCQAESMFKKFYSPNILAIASSHIGEDSLSVSITRNGFVVYCCMVFDWPRH